MECSGSSEAAPSGGNCQKPTALGSQCMPDLPNGGMTAHWKECFTRFLGMRGGLNTKIHAVVDGLGNPVKFLLSAGNDNDCVHAVELLENVELRGSNVLADRAYGARSIWEYISKHGMHYVIPPQSNVSNPWPLDWYLYKERHLVECFFQKIKWFCRIATRCDKLDASFLAFVCLAAIAILSL